VKRWYEKYFLIKNRRHRGLVFAVSCVPAIWLGLVYVGDLKDFVFPQIDTSRPMEMNLLLGIGRIGFEYAAFIVAGFLALILVQGIYNLFFRKWGDKCWTEIDEVEFQGRRR
jgi:hypothetical protein